MRAAARCILAEPGDAYELHEFNREDRVSAFRDSRHPVRSGDVPETAQGHSRCHECAHDAHASAQPHARLRAPEPDRPVPAHRGVVRADVAHRRNAHQPQDQRTAQRGVPDRPDAAKSPGGAEIPVQLPPGARILGPRWSSDGTHFAFTNTTASGMELWIGDTTGKTHKVEGVRVNGVMGGAAELRPVDARQQEPAGGDCQGEPRRGARASPCPPARTCRRAWAARAPAATLEDMLQTPHDEDLFVYYATSQLAIVDAGERQSDACRQARNHLTVRISPDGKDLLVPRLTNRSRTCTPPVRSPTRSKCGTSPARCSTKWPAFRWKTRCRSTACPPVRATSSGGPAIRPR